ncbi:chloroplastic lipocalin, partial [Thalictrum thalictroides]
MSQIAIHLKLFYCLYATLIGTRKDRCLDLAFSLVFEVNAEELSHYSNVCQLAAVTNSNVPLKIDDGSDEGNGKLMMMRGMSAKNFDPVRYSGRWFEVASLKGGFAGQGQEDCHCTQ